MPGVVSDNPMEPFSRGLTSTESTRTKILVKGSLHWVSPPGSKKSLILIVPFIIMNDYKNYNIFIRMGKFEWCRLSLKYFTNDADHHILMNIGYM